MWIKKLAWTIAITLICTLTGCNTGDNDPTTPDQNQGGMTNEDGGPNDGVKAQNFRPLYRDNRMGDWRSRFFSMNRQDHEGELGTRPMTDENDVFQTVLGFSEYTADDSKARYRGFGRQTYTVDRQLLADLIGQVVVGMPDVDSASVLVTDQHCLIAYSADGAARDVDRQISLAADSIAPGWYKVYATADPRLREHIRQLARQYNNNTDLENLTSEVNALIEQMNNFSRQNNLK